MGRHPSFQDLEQPQIRSAAQHIAIGDLGKDVPPRSLLKILFLPNWERPALKSVGEGRSMAPAVLLRWTRGLPAAIITPDRSGFGRAMGEDCGECKGAEAAGVSALLVE
jgi:hypothetical protein